MGWVEDSKGREPWEFEPQDDWKGSAGLGPWEFTKRADKNCYNLGSSIVCRDESVWSMEDDSGIPGTPIHNPYCGYWHSTPVDEIFTGANIFGLFVGSPDKDAIYGVHFDGKELTYFGMYQPYGVDLSGLTLYEGNLITVANSGSTAALRQIDPENLTLAGETYPFNDYDFTATTDTQLIHGAEKDSIFFVSGDEGRFVKLDNLLRSGRGFLGTVVNGTDGHLYWKYSSYTGWDDQYRPVTGGSWSSIWRRIQDDDCDSRIRQWGDPITLYGGRNSFVRGTVDDELYLGSYGATHNWVRRIKKSSFEIEDSGTAGHGWFMVERGSEIYRLEGVTTCKASSYEKKTLAKLESSETISDYPGDVIHMGKSNCLILITKCTHGGGLYKIDPGSLGIVDSIPRDTILQACGCDGYYTKLAKINDRYVVAGRSTGLTVFDVEAMVVVDDIEIPNNVINHSDFVVM